MGPENRFIKGVHDKLPNVVYREKMNNPYRGGTFDVWYSGMAADLWIEYKWIPRMPTRMQVVPRKLMEPLQFMWGAGRHAEGRNVFVAVGCPYGGVLFACKPREDVPRTWEEGVSAEEFRKALLTKFALAQWIFNFATGEKLDANRRKTSKHRHGDGSSVQNPPDGLPDL